MRPARGYSESFSLKSDGVIWFFFLKFVVKQVMFEKPVFSAIVEIDSSVVSNSFSATVKR